MRLPAERIPFRALAAALAASAGACLSGGHSPATTPPPPSDCANAPAIPAGQPFTVSGNVVYDFVPARYSPSSGTGGLDFSTSAVEQRPVREADVEIRQCGNVLAATTTDAGGHYAATFTPGAQGGISVYVLARTASPPLTVVDNTSAGAIWTVAQPLVSAAPTLDVHATHGWTGTGYGASRIAAPFAILDDLYTAAHRLLDLPRAVGFDAAPLTVNWSPLNSPSYCTSPAGLPYADPAQGCIGTSYYDPSVRQIFVLGAAGSDTDEFDREVIVHEWGHYFEDTFSRSDSPGGSHGLGDVLDPRLAFGEGYASAFAAMLLQQTVYADTYWSPSGMTAFGWDVESVPFPTDDPSPGPFSELSIIRAMWDLYDAPTDPGSTAEAWDAVATGLGPIYDTLVGPERTTPALTTIGSFVAGLKAQAGVDGAGVDAVLAHYGIGPIASPWGDGDAALRAAYTDVAAPTSTPASLTATLDGSADWNQRPQNQYYVFTAAGTTATVTTSCTYDVDLYGFHAGQIPGAFAESTSGNETIRFATTPGETYVVVLTGWGGAPSGQAGVGTYTATVTFSN